MTRKRRRLYLIIASLVCLAAAAGLVLSAFEENIVFFHSPSDVAAAKVTPERRFRLGGLVAEGSVERGADGTTVLFRVTDTAHEVQVRYQGLLPDLFREGQGIVAEGRLAADGTFEAAEVLAKHDETYMPPEVAKALKEAGQWKGDEE